MIPTHLIDLLTFREVDRRNPADMVRWREAQADALRERLRAMEEAGR